MSALVSIIIPTFNRSSLIGETLESVIVQTYSNWECIVVDDGSNDYTRELIEFYNKRDSRIKYFSRPESLPKGANSCRNFGFEKSNGEYIQWFDSDDIMHPELLEEKIKYLEENPQKDYCLSQMTAFKGYGKTREYIKTTSIKFQNLFEDYVTEKVSAGTPSILWRKKVLQQQEMLFDERLRSSQDLEFHSRLFRVNKNIGVLSKPLIFFRIHDETISREFFTLKEGQIDSFLEVRKRILNLDPKNRVINAAVISSVLGVFRTCLTHHQYWGCEKCLAFVKKHNLNESTGFQIGFIRVKILYQIFKLTGRGDTRFRRWLKINQKLH